LVVSIVAFQRPPNVPSSCMIGTHIHEWYTSNVPVPW
jgi:hypothetical protein